MQFCYHPFCSAVCVSSESGLGLPILVPFPPYSFHYSATPCETKSTCFHSQCSVALNQSKLFDDQCLVLLIISLPIHVAIVVTIQECHQEGWWVAYTSKGICMQENMALVQRWGGQIIVQIKTGGLHIDMGVNITAKISECHIKGDPQIMHCLPKHSPTTASPILHIAQPVRADPALPYQDSTNTKLII